MKTTIIATSLFRDNWNGHRGKFGQIFTRLTGYDIMYEESRKDQQPAKRKSPFRFSFR